MKNSKIKSRSQTRESARFGFTLVESLVVIAIIAVLAGISLVVFRKVQQSAHSAVCLSNMRQVALVHMRLAQENNGAMVHTWKSRPFGSWQRNWSQFHTIFLDEDLDWRENPATVDSHMRQVKFLQCPSAAKLHASEMGKKSNHDGWRTYALNQRIGRQDDDPADQKQWIDGAQTLAQVVDMSKLILLVERAWDGSTYPAGCLDSNPKDPSGFFDGHGGKTNVAFLDGHVESQSPNNVPVVGATRSNGAKVNPLPDEWTSLTWRGTKTSTR